MRPLTDDRGGIVAKLLGILLVLAILASAAVYVYGKGQQPLEADIAHTATSDGDRQAATIGVGPHMAVYAATIVRNAGRLPVTIEGLASVPREPSQPYVPITIELGDGKTANPTNGAFVPPSLDPGTGIGVVVTYAIDPNLDCSAYTRRPSKRVPFPPLPLRLSSYGVDTTQTLTFEIAPTVSGITEAACERALP
jgi:hypothetical protein